MTASDLTHSPLRELASRVAGGVETTSSWNKAVGRIHAGHPLDRQLVEAQQVQVDRPGDLGGSDPWEDAELCLHSGSTRMSCANVQ
jgi:hypothetical protein